MYRPCLNLARTAAKQQFNVAKRFASTSSTLTPALLNSIELQWTKLNEEERKAVTSELSELQKQDWKKLSAEEKRAAYYIAFGPHGPREPLPAYGFKVFFGVLGLLGASAGTFLWARSLAQPPPHTMTTEWQEATNEYMKGQKANPITGISSEGYKGKGFVGM
ncbi:cytochrome c oxidase polypeptide V [Conidiobolus coronatus NRRL 28638]|uniref:Cytochrome c oxidase polypeptide V n=1 Tax=Conidiobolus coronatus (strain ATCC 28846 / CBS 209.66 / NRRL 28638) TaxID=796925 RepID=A0A137P4R1_CONC2|nr:cytochrome c oxidase polypeptide V [Conidiobolus coronatus NRRL 28638]|eukprot:KXN69904.1 cytochrome c oxidase polypeptide V [Conidiobolus coronatus NRRL 28638]